MKCLICDKSFDTDSAVFFHVKIHGISSEEYKTKFNLHKVCSVCGKRVSKRSKKGFCNKCRPRSGEDNPFYGKTHTTETVDRIKVTTSKKSKELWQDQEYRDRIKRTTTGLKRSDEFKETQRLNAIKQFEDTEQRDIRSVRMKKSWVDGCIPKAENYNINRSKCELELLSTLTDTFGGLVSNNTIRIGDSYYFPDIVIDNKVIIEYFGDYWHANPSKYPSDYIIERTKKIASDIWDFDNKRIEMLKSGGYDVIVVWESDYKRDKTDVIRKIIKYVEGDKNVYFRNHKETI